MAVTYLLLPWRIGVCDQSDVERERERERESYTAYHIYLKKWAREKFIYAERGIILIDNIRPRNTFLLKSR